MSTIITELAAAESRIKASIEADLQAFRGRVAKIKEEALAEAAKIESEMKGLLTAQLDEASWQTTSASTEHTQINEPVGLGSTVTGIDLTEHTVQSLGATLQLVQTANP